MSKRERDFPAIEKAVSDLYQVLPAASVVIHLDGPRPWTIDIEDRLIRVEIGSEDPGSTRSFVFHLGKTDALTLAAILTGLAQHCEESAI